MKKAIFMLSAAVIGCCAFGLAMKSVAADGNGQYKLLGTLEESYTLGESVLLPDCTVEVNGESRRMERTVVYPDGRTSAYQTVTLDSLGEYSVVYTYDEFETALSFETTVSDKASLFTNVENAVIESNVSAGRWSPQELNGVGITFSSGGGKVKYNEVLDLRNKSRYQFFLECIANPLVDGTREIDYIYITLTDIYDTDNFIKLRLQSGTLRGESPNCVYITTTSNDMYSWIAYAPEYREIRESGLSVLMGLAGSGTDKYPALGINTLRLSYLSEDKEMWAQAYPFRSQECVIDYDDPEFVDERYLWDGFTADLAYMTVEVSNKAQSTESRLLFTSVNGTSLSGDNDLDSKTFFFDIDTLGYAEDKLPVGIIGKKYPVFNTRVFDDFGRETGNVNSTVYGSDGKAVPVVNGYFLPEQAGEYTIEYRAENEFYFERKQIKMTVAEVGAPVTYSFSPYFVSEAKYGDKIFIKEGVADGGIGALSVRMSISINGEQVETYNYGLGEFFTAQLSGTYEVKAEVTDWSGEITDYCHNIVVAEPSSPIMEKPVIPKAAIVGRTLTLPRVDAVMLKNGEKIYVPVKVYIGDINVTETLNYVPEAEGDFTVRYVAENPFGGENTEEIFTVGARDTAALGEGEYYIDAFLKTDGFTKEYVNNYYTLVADGSAEKATLSFVLPVTDEFLFLGFSVEEGYGNFETATVTFTDTENAEECLQMQVKRRLLNGVQVSGFYLNGVFINSLEASLDGVGTSTFGFGYDKKNNAIIDSISEKICGVNNNAYGDKFNGFSSGYAYIDFEIDGIKSASRVRFIKLSSQNVTNASSDRIAPQFVFGDEFAEAYTKYVNDYFTLGKVNAYDVLSDTVTVSMTISAPDGSEIYSGLYTEGYTFKIEQAGYYSIVLIAKDGSNRSTKYEISISATRFGRPDISVKGVPSTASFGATVFLPAAKAAENCTVYVWVVSPSGFETILTADENGKYTYLFNNSGTYLVKYYVVDEYNNRSVKVFEVKV